MLFASISAINLPRVLTSFDLRKIIESSGDRSPSEAGGLIGACEPKKLVVLPIEHYDIYAGKWFDESARLAREWFERFLN